LAETYRFSFRDEPGRRDFDATKTKTAETAIKPRAKQAIKKNTRSEKIGKEASPPKKSFPVNVDLRR
jgi:hypothetical protein